MYLSGGPGGAGVFEMIDVMLTIPSLLDRFTVIGFDQRGTGASGLLRCPSVERDPRLRSTAAGEACAKRLGARRAFYTTPDSVEDMEAIRKAAGARRLTLFGISYGTELALAYARAYPQRVERLILDSVVDPDESDAYGLAGFRAMAPTLRSLCRPDCVTDDPAGELAALVAALRAEPLRGVVHTARGRTVRQTVRPVAISDLIYDADYAPGAAGRAAGGGARGAGRRRGAAAAAAAHLGELRDAVGARGLLRRPLRHGLRGDAAAVAARDAGLRAPRGGARRRRGARPGRVLPLRRRRGLRRRDRALPALAGPGPAAAQRPAARIRTCPRCCCRARRTSARRRRSPRTSPRCSRARRG